ncbi:MAG: DUF393 domain-containing protein, partial [Bdellovibrionales bacterium]|nr:DUF393 domain-containing protein [Bdellovibrionales bacterium]
MAEQRSPSITIVFYDGTCGLCHWFVSFAIHRDDRGVLRFAPLESPLAKDVIPTDLMPTLPNSVVVRTASGALLLRSDAIGMVLRELGGR